MKLCAKISIVNSLLHQRSAFYIKAKRNKSIKPIVGSCVPKISTLFKDKYDRIEKSWVTMRLLNPAKLQLGKNTTIHADPSRAGKCSIRAVTIHTLQCMYVGAQSPSVYQL